MKFRGIFKILSYKNNYTFHEILVFLFVPKLQKIARPIELKFGWLIDPGFFLARIQICLAVAGKIKRIYVIGKYFN